MHRYLDLDSTYLFSTASLMIKVPAGKLMSIPQGIMSVTTKACFQYVSWTGIVATRIEPTKNASMEMSITQPGPMREITWPVVMAAMKPEIATGDSCAIVRSGDVPRSCCSICM